MSTVGVVARLLVVEDDEGIVTLLAHALRREGFELEVLDRGEPVVDRVVAGGIDLLLLDLSLPDIDGLDVCRRVRERAPSLPIVMLTGRGSELDVVAGLEAGAHDYVAKPFRLAELVARLRVNLRPSTGVHTVVSAAPTEQSGVRVDPDTRRAWRGDHELDLTPTEFDVLALLLSEAGRVLSRQRIVDHVRRAHGAGSDRSLDMHISSLRKKLLDADPTGKSSSDDGSSARLIATVRGVGFRFETD